jgi:hypothetical protein
MLGSSPAETVSEPSSAPGAKKTANTPHLCWHCRSTRVVDVAMHVSWMHVRGSCAQWRGHSCAWSEERCWMWSKYASVHAVLENHPQPLFDHPESPAICRWAHAPITHEACTRSILESIRVHLMPSTHLRTLLHTPPPDTYCPKCRTAHSDLHRAMAMRRSRSCPGRRPRSLHLWRGNVVMHTHGPPSNICATASSSSLVQASPPSHLLGLP